MRWYPTDAYEAFAANAECAETNMIGVTTAAPAITCNTKGLETIIDHVSRVSCILAVPFDGEVWSRTADVCVSRSSTLARSYLHYAILR